MIHHFYHIYADGGWQEPVQEHIRALQMGLYEALDTFAVGIVGSQERRTHVKQYLDSTGLKYAVAAEADSGWEQVTQIPMWEFSKSNDGIILYAHTKGAYDPNNVNVRWRRSMCYWNVIRWADAVERLKECETYGCHWIYPQISMPEHKYGNPMYAGTFYWTRCELMRTWMQPTVEHRHAAEGWCGYKYVQKPWKAWDCTPYFPNAGPFADDWVNNPLFVYEDCGKFIEPVVLHGKQTIPQ